MMHRLLAVGMLAALVGCAAPLPKSPLQFPGYTSLYRPDGPGPFPAVVILPTCGGVANHLYDWAQRLKAEGYVALVVNNLTPRNVRMNCDNWTVTVDDVASDALAARAYLR